MTIRKALFTDQEAIWDIFQDVVSRGDTYVFSPDITKEEALSLHVIGHDSEDHFTCHI